jgi:hypothetical protein
VREQNCIFFSLHKIHVYKIACPLSNYRRAHACGTAAASDWGAGTFQKRPEASPLATAGFSKNAPTAGEDKRTVTWNGFFIAALVHTFLTKIDATSTGA